MDTESYPACMTRRQALRVVALVAGAIPLVSCGQTASVGNRGDCGYIDEGGSWVVSPSYKWAGPFSEGLGLVVTSEGDRSLTGLVGTDGKLVGDPVEASPQAVRLSQGLVAAHSPRLGLGYLDASSVWTLYPRGTGEYFMQADSFSPADAFCSEAYALVLDEDSRKWGVLGSDGEWIVEPSFADVVHSYSGARPATQVGLMPMKSAQAPGLWGFVDVSGEWRVAPSFSDASWFHGDVAYARDPENGLMGTVDPSGAWVVPAAYSAISFAAGSGSSILARDSGSGLWGTVSPSGWVAPPRWREVGITDSVDSLLALDDAVGLWGVASPSGEWAVDPAWTDVDERAGVSGGLVVARDAASGLWGVASTVDGSWKVGPSYRAMGAGAGLSFPMPVQDAKTGSWGYVSGDGGWAVTPRFGIAEPFSGGLAVVSESEGEVARGCVTYVDGTPVPKTEDVPSNRLLSLDKDLKLG